MHVGNGHIPRVRRLQADSSNCRSNGYTGNRENKMFHHFPL
jgi:hypothetical protein